jgi:hypothetical protein
VPRGAGAKYGVLMAGAHALHPGGGFNPPEPTTKGGPDYGRFINAVRALQDHARAVDAPDEVISEAADLIEKVSDLLSPFDADEWQSPSGRRMDLLNRGDILPVPMKMLLSSGNDFHGLVGWSQRVEDFAGDVAFDAAYGFFLRFAFGETAGDVVAGGLVAAHPEPGRCVERGWRHDSLPG